MAAAATSRAREFIAAYPELAAVLTAAAIGLSAHRPLGWLARHGGISALLALLVLATAVTIDLAALRRLATAWRSVLTAVVTGVTVLPALSWAAAHLVAPGPLRDGVAVAGLAPCEIASVAATALAGGEATIAAGTLIGSTLATVALAGPILAIESGHASRGPGPVIASLALVVALPLAAGIALRALAQAPPPPGPPPPPGLPTPPGPLPPPGLPAATALTVTGARSATHIISTIRVSTRIGGFLRPLATPRAGTAATRIALATVAALVALIAAEVHPSAGYAAVTVALAAFLLASVLVGRLLARRAPRPAATALLLTTSMRDFAIAAGLAAAAFGAPAAAPLGVYGVLVLVWGTAAAGVLRNRVAPGAASSPPESG